MGLRLFLGDLARNMLWHTFEGVQWNVLICGIFSGSLSSLHLVVLIANNCGNRASIQCRAVSKTIDASLVDPCQLLPLPAIEFDTIPNVT